MPTYRSAPITPKELTADQLIQRFRSTREKEPEVDQAKIERLQKMGRLNQVGRGINLIGDIAGSAMGANVKRRNPDTTTPYLYNAYQDTLDKYKAEKDAYQIRDYRKQLDDIQLGLSDAYRKEDKAYQAKVHDDSMAAQAAKNKLDWEKYLAGLTQKERDAAERARHNKTTEGISGGKLKLERDKFEKGLDKKEKPFMIAGVNGQDVPLTQGQFRDLLAEATRVANESGTNSPQYKDFQATMNAFKDNPLEGQKNIVQRYYNWKKEQESLERNRKLKGIPSATPQQPVQQAAPNTNKPVVDYSKLVY